MWSRCAASRSCDCLPLLCLFPVGQRVRVRGWVGVPPLRGGFLFVGGVCLFLPLPSLGWCLHWLAFGVANRVSVGVVGDCGPWSPMYTRGLVACAVGLGAGFAGWAVPLVGFVRSWAIGGWGSPVSPCPCGAGLIFLVQAGRRCRGGGLLTGVWWPLARAWRRGVALSHRLGVIPSFPHCGLMSLALVLWCALVHRVGLCCAAVPSTSSCRAVLCRAAVCLALVGRATP